MFLEGSIQNGSFTKYNFPSGAYPTSLRHSLLQRLFHGLFASSVTFSSKASFTSSVIAHSHQRGRPFSNLLRDFVAARPSRDSTSLQQLALCFFTRRTSLLRTDGDFINGCPHHAHLRLLLVFNNSSLDRGNVEGGVDDDVGRR